MNSLSIDKLREIVGDENIPGHKADLYVYGSDASVHEAMPQVIVRPQKHRACPGHHAIRQ